MNFYQYWQKINNHKTAFAMPLLVALLVSGLWLYFQPWQYRAETQILLVQEFKEGLDPYNASRSNEYLSTILARVVSTNIFYEQVLAAGFNISRAYFSDNPEKQLRIWQSTVKASSVYDTGIINIKVYHEDKYQLEQITRAINFTLLGKHQQYHGGGDKISLKIISTPVYSQKIARPNLPLTLVFAGLLGLIFSFAIVYLLSDSESTDERVSAKPVKQEHQDQAGREMNIDVSFAEEPARINVPKRPDIFTPENRQSNKQTADVSLDKIDDLSYEEVIKKGSMDNVL